MKRLPDPVCRCGHPRASHHRTASGAITYCTIWTLNAPDDAPARQCPCKRYEEAA